MKENGNSTRRWEILRGEDGVVQYKGFVEGRRPWGAGTAYYPTGIIYQEGVFGAKGLLCGREYYPNGQMRFEGLYRYNNAYGPNFPVYGIFYDESGGKQFEGRFRVIRGGVGYPTVIEPANFGHVPLPDAPRIK